MNEGFFGEIGFGKWLWVTFAGWFLGVVLILVLSGMFDSLEIEGFQFYLGVGMGLGVGVVQWLLLRKKVSWLWFAASTVGMGLPFVFFDFFPLISGDFKLPVCVFLGSVLTGSLQFLLLKTKGANALIWIPGSIAGWTVAACSVFLINLTRQIKVSGYMNLVLALVNLVLILSGGVILGLLTGLSIKRISEKAK